MKFLNKLEEYKEVKQFELPSIEKANEIQLATENTTVKEALLAVSYTHLDVYKRQHY